MAAAENANVNYHAAFWWGVVAGWERAERETQELRRRILECGNAQGDAMRDIARGGTPFEGLPEGVAEAIGSDDPEEEAARQEAVKAAFDRTTRTTIADQVIERLRVESVQGPGFAWRAFPAWLEQAIREAIETVPG